VAQAPGLPRAELSRDRDVTRVGTGHVYGSRNGVTVTVISSPRSNGDVELVLGVHAGTF